MKKLMQMAMIAAAGAFAGSVQAESLTVSFESSHANSVQIEFYSQDRNIA